MGGESCTVLRLRLMRKLAMSPTHCSATLLLTAHCSRLSVVENAVIAGDLPVVLALHGASVETTKLAHSLGSSSRAPWSEAG